MAEEKRSLQVLTQEQVDTFRRDGVLVVPGLLSDEEADRVSDEFHKFLAPAMKIYHDDIKSSQGLSNARLAGIVDCFWQKWKMDLNSNPKFIDILQDLYDHTYGSETASNPDDLFYSPFAPLHKEENGRTNLFYYIDRANYRIPKDVLPIKGLPIHVDCDPKFLYDRLPKTEEELKRASELLGKCMEYQKDGSSDPKDMEGRSKALTEKRDLRWKWRPFQSFVALTDNPHKDLGGFMAIKEMFAKITSKECTDLMQHSKPNGEFTVLENFPEIHEKIEDIIYKKGDLVIWDWRTPHTNAESHLGYKPREVVYIQVMPDIGVNRIYAACQRKCFEDGYFVPLDFARLISYQETIIGEPWKPTTPLQETLLGMKIPVDDPSNVIVERKTKESNGTCTVL
jgi:hypothetical protein